MSFQDYIKSRDKFELGDGQHFGGFDFPCCDCDHVIQSADMEPCRTYDHNVNAVLERNERSERMEIPFGALLGIRFKCANGHEWECAVGGVWLQMPTCPECKPEMTVPAVAWIGRWEGCETRKSPIEFGAKDVAEWNARRRMTWYDLMFVPIQSANMVFTRADFS